MKKALLIGGIIVAVGAGVAVCALAHGCRPLKNLDLDNLKL